MKNIKSLYQLNKKKFLLILFFVLDLRIIGNSNDFN